MFSLAIQMFVIFEVACFTFRKLSLSSAYFLVESAPRHLKASQLHRSPFTLLEKIHTQLCKSIAVKLQRSNHVYPYLCYTYKSQRLICSQPHIVHSLCTEYLVCRFSKSKEIKLPYIYIHTLKLKEDFFVNWAKNFLPFADLTSLKRKRLESFIFAKSKNKLISQRWKWRLDCILFTVIWVSAKVYLYFSFLLLLNFPFCQTKVSIEFRLYDFISQ